MENIPIYPKHHNTDLTTDNGATPIPNNIFVNYRAADVFGNKIAENHKWEQFFWTKDVVEKLATSLSYTYLEETCCLCTPSMTHQWYTEGRDEVLLDIDKRFDYLPKFRYYDMANPQALDDSFRLIVIDPPFFAVPIETVRAAVDKITGKRYDTCILIAFLKRGEKRLRTAFADYKLVPTKFQLQYASIKPNKWGNFVLYSNVDLPGIKRIKEK